MKYLLILAFLTLNYPIFSFHPIDEIPEEYRNLPEIRLYSSGNITLEDNYFNIETITPINDSDEDIYIFWSNFLAVNLLDKNVRQGIKKQITTNEILIYDTNFTQNQKTLNYKDSAILNYPVFLKFPSKKNIIEKVRNRGFSITFYQDNLSNDLKNPLDYSNRFSLVLNYLKESDIKKINNELGINIIKNTIMLTSVNFSSFQRLKNGKGYLECFESEELGLDPNKVEQVLKKYIKQVKTEEILNVYEIDYKNK